MATTTESNKFCVVTTRVNKQHEKCFLFIYLVFFSRYALTYAYEFSKEKQVGFYIYIFEKAWKRLTGHAKL